MANKAINADVEQLPGSGTSWRFHVRFPMPLKRACPAFDGLFIEGRNQIMGESVSDLAHQPQIVAHHFADEAKAVKRSDPIPIRPQGLVVLEQRVNLFLIVNQEVTDDVLELRIQKRGTDDDHRAIIRFLCEQSRKFDQCHFEVEVTIKIFPDD
nr:hypothetical protein [Anatilimnocola floriformis]